MTTKLFDNQICTFKFLLSWRFPRKKKKKTAFWTIFLSAPKAPSKIEHFIFIVVSLSLTKSPVEVHIFYLLRNLSTYLPREHFFLHGNPRTGLLRAFWEPDRFLRSPLRRVPSVALPYKEERVYEQSRSYLAFFRALLASTWGHYSQTLIFTVIW